MGTTSTASGGNPTTLLAILVAARRSGDRDLERIARGRLEAEHGIKVTFPRRPKHKPEGAPDA